eukprot:scaffold442700_cov37-Prasinocladus_malaysianus.AAC.1
MCGCGVPRWVCQRAQTLDADGAATQRGTMCGRIVSNHQQAIAAEEESVDFVMVMLPEQDEGQEDSERSAHRAAACLFRILFVHIITIP